MITPSGSRELVIPMNEPGTGYWPRMKVRIAVGYGVHCLDGNRSDSCVARS